MRLHQIDALRGFALFGILIVNIFVFHAPYSHYTAFYGKFEGLEGLVIENMIFFFGGKFMFIYAFLFGYSFWLQYQKIKDKNRLSAYWNKRMLILAIFGLLHILLLSYGDILLPYALLGLSLPFFVRLKDRWVILCFLLVYLIPVYEFVLRGFVNFPSIFIQPILPLEEYITSYSSGDVWEIFKLRLKDYFSLRNEKLIMYIPKELALFLTGMLAGKYQLAQRISWRLAVPFIIVAFGTIGAMFFFRSQIIGLFDYENSVVQRSLLGLTIQFSEFMHGGLYIIGFLFLWKNKMAQKLLYLLQFPGRLSLTNYLVQSLICSIIFNYMGYYGQLLPSQLIIMAFVIFIIQVIFSYWWLQKHAQGPIEKLWRNWSSVKS
ncbi:MAG: DUF418 domain-containing protein [Saprospiraceae bacterium]|nr:DUF418 domain-containing protein [Saprospiraceae bacterium]